jgi:hypothetical protein
MTCRDFKHYAASLSLQELAKMEDPQIAGHAQACSNCDSWLQKQRALNASIHALRTRTVGHEAGPSVERELLRVFRQGIPVGKMSASNAEVAAVGVKGPLETIDSYSKAAPRFTPFALRLSRIFEIGAYAAVAAAILVALFLGVHLLRHGSTPPMQSKSALERTAPAIQQRTVNQSNRRTASGTVTSAVLKRHETRSLHSSVGSHPQTILAAGETSATADDTQSDEAGYMALMFCDPLSCASDTQVVRMELPNATNTAEGVQPQVADMVVGYDGVVRAIRFEN